MTAVTRRCATGYLARVEGGVGAMVEQVVSGLAVPGTVVALAVLVRECANAYATVSKARGERKLADRLSTVRAMREGGEGQ